MSTEEIRAWYSRLVHAEQSVEVDVSVYWDELSEGTLE